MTRSAEFRHSQVAVRGSSVHVIEAGDPGARAVVFLHGWPESYELARAVIADVVIPGVDPWDEGRGTRGHLASHR